MYVCMYMKESRPMGAAISNFCFVIARKLLFLSAPLAHDLLYFRKATSALRGGQYPVLCFVLAFFFKNRDVTKSLFPMHSQTAALPRFSFSMRPFLTLE